MASKAANRLLREDFTAPELALELHTMLTKPGLQLDLLDTNSVDGRYARLEANNSFTGDQSIDGDLTSEKGTFTEIEVSHQSATRGLYVHRAFESALQPLVEISSTLNAKQSALSVSGAGAAAVCTIAHQNTAGTALSLAAGGLSVANGSFSITGSSSFTGAVNVTGEITASTASIPIQTTNVLNIAGTSGVPSVLVKTPNGSNTLVTMVGDTAANYFLVVGDTTPGAPDARKKGIRSLGPSLFESTVSVTGQLTAGNISANNLTLSVGGHITTSTIQVIGQGSFGSIDSGEVVISTSTSPALRVNNGARIENGLTVPSGHVTVTTGNMTITAGSLTAMNGCSFGTITASGVVFANAGLAVNGSEFQANAGATTTTLTASGLVTANAGLTVNATVLTANAGISATTITASGLLSANAGISTTSITASGAIGCASLSASGDIAGAGITASGVMTANAGLAVNNSVLQANDGIDVVGSVLTVHEGSELRLPSGQVAPFVYQVNWQYFDCYVADSPGGSANTLLRVLVEGLEVLGENAFRPLP